MTRVNLIGSAHHGGTGQPTHPPTHTLTSADVATLQITILDWKTLITTCEASAGSGGVIDSGWEGVVATNGRPVGWEGVVATNGRPVGWEGVVATNGRPVGWEGVVATNGRPVGWEGVVTTNGRPVGWEGVVATNGRPAD